jgi:CelD/BcsL family acetyltransferase involved in cellulose biosynthesis
MPEGLAHPGAARWERQGQSLKFTLGDYCYWQFRFEALVHSAPLTYLLQNANAGHPLQGAEAGCDAYVIRSLPIAGQLPRIAHDGAYIRYAPAQYSRYFVEIEGSFEEYLARFSGKSRSTWKRKVRKFADRSGGVTEWRQYRTVAEMNEFYPLALELSTKTYQDKMFNEGLAAQIGTKDRLLALAERDSVRAYMLFLKGEPVAYVFCPCRSGTIEYASLGYDPNLRSLSPGDVLLHLLLERLFAEGDFQVLDFGEGENWYKEFYATRSIACARVYYFRRTLRNRVAVWLHSGATALSDLAGRILNALRIRDLVRRLLRNWATADAARAD